MTATEEYLLKEIAHLEGAHKAYKLLYDVYLLQSCVDDVWTIPTWLSEEVEGFFRGENGDAYLR